MKSIKIILITLLFCSVSFVNAKNGTQVITTSDTLTVKIDSANLDKRLRKIKGVSSVKIDTEKQTVVIEYQNDKKTIQEIDKVKKKNNAILVESVVAEKMVEKSLEGKTVKEEVKKTPVEQLWRFNPDFDKFLNIEDESIFNTKFMDIQQTQIHPRSWNYYLLIKNIHELEILLSEVSKTTLGQKTQAKDKLTKAKRIMDEIDKTNGLILNSLSKIQKSFYFNLTDEYERLRKELYDE